MKAVKTHRTIGQVLEELRPEFSDVTVSKIRFLESAGLISPERTPSGYRKFTQHDVDRLRLVLAWQRDSFLPLREIKQRLDAGITDAPRPVPAASPPGETPPAASPAPAPPAAAPPDLDDPGPEVQLTEADLASASGLEVAQVKELKQFGILCEHGSNGLSYFDRWDLHVGKLARDLIDLGIDPRHMSSIRRSAEQDAGLIQQLVSPAMRNRNTDVRSEAREKLGALAATSKQFRHALVRRLLSTLIDEDR
ncbi:MAG TPA: MerR family transcriptional regulator [Actinomycetota bacterium]